MLTKREVARWQEQVFGVDESPACACGAVEGVTRHRGLCPNNNHEVIEVLVGAEPSRASSAVV